MCLFFEVQTEWGLFAVGATERGILRVYFPGPDAHAALALPTGVSASRRSGRVQRRHAESGARALRAYFRDEDYEAGCQLDLSGATAFRRDVYEALMTVPFGATVSYGELAILSGHPGAARAVGSAMRKNRTPILVPCHRVVSSGQGLGGWSGPPGLKARLLAHEGITLEKRLEVGPPLIESRR
jgi:methylated-DNA-[protein]-cysteine S-methyltransferase